MPLPVQALVFSGRPDPTFVLEDAQLDDLAALARASLAAPPVAALPPPQLGYRGFALEPPPALALPARLIVGKGYLVADVAGGQTAWTDRDGASEAFLKERARAAGLGPLVDPDL